MRWVLAAFCLFGLVVSPAEAKRVKTPKSTNARAMGETHKSHGKHAETLMTQTQAEQLIELGFIPVIGWRDQERIQIGMFQAITGKALRGRWNQ